MADHSNRSLRRKGAPTLVDVARRAGLSPSTISIALNAPLEQCRLNPRTRQKAIDAAEQLGYRANWRAQALARRRTQTIGLLYARKAPFMTGTNEAIFDAMAATFSNAGYFQLLVPFTASIDSWDNIIRPDRLDGCAIINPAPEGLERLVKQLPTVLVNLCSDLPVAQIRPDDHGGAAELTDYLLDLGHEKIAFYMTPDTAPHFSVVERIAGYRSAMKQKGLERNVCLVDRIWPDEFVRQLCRPESEITAVITYDHIQAIAVRHDLWAAGVDVPGRISLATFNDIDLLSHMTPPLTTVAIPGAQIGEAAATRLIQQIEEGESRQVEPLILQGKVVRRASTGRPPPK